MKNIIDVTEDWINGLNEISLILSRRKYDTSMQSLNKFLKNKQTDLRASKQLYPSDGDAGYSIDLRITNDFPDIKIVVVSEISHNDGITYTHNESCIWMDQLFVFDALLESFEGMVEGFEEKYQKDIELRVLPNNDYSDLCGDDEDE